MGVVSERPIPIIFGPTASGKTGAAVQLAERFPIEVISADSRQIYKRLDIGTAKPTPEECSKVRFHIVDIIEPGERYSAFRFVDDALAACEDIVKRDRIPVVVGGTGLYLRALTDGVVEIEESDLAVRSRLEREMDELGPEAMHERLMNIDPLEASNLHPNNKVRVIRALEIFELTGKCKSEIAVTGAYHKTDQAFSYYSLTPERQDLYEVINRRVDEMMAAGWLDEVQKLSAEGREKDIRRSRVIGYAELLDHLAGRMSLPEAIALIKQSTRRYAKRQYTWLRHQVVGQTFADRASLVAKMESDLAGWL